MRLQAYQIPHDARAGCYPLVYGLRSAADGGTIERTLWVCVQPVLRASLDVLERPDLILAGEEARFTFRLSNRGNVDLDMELRGSCRDGWPVGLEPSGLWLPAGQSRRIEVTVQVPESLDRMNRQHFRLEAEGWSGRKICAPAKSELYMDALPRMSAGVDAWHRLPSEIQILSHWKGGGNRLSAQWSGKGILDEGGQTRIDFLLRGPDSRAFSALGTQEELRLNLSGPRGGLYLGDGGYALSGLTRRSLMGRGFEVNYHFDNEINLRSLYVDGSLGGRGRELGARLDRDFGEGGRLGFSFLGLLGEGGSGSLRSRTFSLDGARPLFREIALQGEGALSEHEGRWGGAGSLRLDRLGQRLKFNVERILANAEYQGYYRDYDYISGTFSAQMTDRWQLRGMGWRVNRNLWTEDGRSPGWGRQFELGLQHFASASTSWGLSAQQSELVGERPGTVPASITRTLRAEAGHAADGLRMNLRMEGGWNEEGARERQGRLVRVSGSASWNLVKKLTFSVYGSYDRIQAFEEARSGSSSSRSAAIMYRPDLRLELQIRAHRIEYRYLSASSFDQFDLSCRMRMTRDLVLDFRGRERQLAGGDWDTSLTLGVIRSLGMPLRRVEGLARLEGRIVDRESPDGAGVPDLLLRLDRHLAVTDSEGRFLFPNIPAGDYLLDLSRPSLGIEKALVQNGPLPLSLEAGARKRIELEVASTSRIDGRVALFGSERAGDPAVPSAAGKIGKLVLEGRSLAKQAVGDGGDASPTAARWVESYGLEGVLLRIQGEGREFHRMSDAQGCFSFEQLVPGHWVLEVVDTPLPAGHYLEKARLTFDLEAGCREELIFRVLPRHRTVRLIDEDRLDEARLDRSSAGQDRSPVLPSRDSILEEAALDPGPGPLASRRTGQSGTGQRPDSVAALRPASRAPGVQPVEPGAPEAQGGPALERFEPRRPDPGAGVLHRTESEPGDGQRTGLRYGHTPAALVQPVDSGLRRERRTGPRRAAPGPRRRVLDGLRRTGRRPRRGGGPARPGRGPPVAGLPPEALARPSRHRRGGSGSGPGR